jgi:hypothetical protein
MAAHNTGVCRVGYDLGTSEASPVSMPGEAIANSWQTPGDAASPVQAGAGAIRDHGGGRARATDCAKVFGRGALCLDFGDQQRDLRQYQWYRQVA